MEPVVAADERDPAARCAARRIEFLQTDGACISGGGGTVCQHGLGDGGVGLVGDSYAPDQSLIKIQDIVPLGKGGPEGLIRSTKRERDNCVVAHNDHKIRIFFVVIG